jgi:hypothetical protein
MMAPKRSLLPSFGSALGVATGCMLLALAAVAAAATHRRGVAGRTTARHALLRRSDLGSGWSQNAPAPQHVPRLTCRDFDPSVRGVRQTGAAAGATFQGGSSGPFLSQSAYAYATPAERGIFWQRVVRPKLVRCVADALKRGSGQGVSFKVTGEHLLALPKLPARAAGYRVVGTASTTLQTIDVYLDMIVLGRGNAVTQISLSSFSEPVDRALELRLARRAANRLPAGPR